MARTKGVPEHRDVKAERVKAERRMTRRAAAALAAQNVTIHQDDNESVTSGVKTRRQASKRDVLGDLSNDNRERQQGGASKKSRATTRSASMGANARPKKNNKKKMTAASEGALLQAALAADSEPQDIHQGRRRSARLSSSNQTDEDDGVKQVKAAVARKKKAPTERELRAASRGRANQATGIFPAARGRSKPRKRVDDDKKRPAKGGKRTKSQPAAKEKRARDDDNDQEQSRAKKPRSSKSRSVSRSQGKKKKTGRPKRGGTPTRISRIGSPAEPANGTSLQVGHNLTRPSLVVEDNDGDFQTAPWDGTCYASGLSEHDQRHSGQVLEAPELVTDIYQRLFHEESKRHVTPYIDFQKEIKPHMRAVLVDWLHEVHLKFRLAPDTMYLAVQLTDRYLSLEQTPRTQLQLVGVTSLLLASKYEEIYPPEVKDLVYICDRAYTRQEILDMEYKILNVLEFDVSAPTGYPFVTRFLFLLNASRTLAAAANYYMERTLQEHDMLSFRASLLAMAAVCLAYAHPEIREEDGLDEDAPGIPPVLLEYTGFDVDSIVEAATAMAHHVQSEPVNSTMNKRKLVTVRRKYDHARFRYISVEYEHPSVDDIISKTASINNNG